MAVVVIVEDNANNLELMRYLLSAAGHRVSCAMTGASGLESAIAVLPDLMILDIQLPDFSGYELLAELRSRADLASCVIIAVTANAMVGDRDNALAAGFDGYISKPIDPREFSTTIDWMLPAWLRGRPLSEQRASG